MQGQNTSTRAGALFVDTVTDPENYFFHILHFDGSVSQELSDTYTGLRLTTISKSSAVFLAAVGRPAGDKGFLGTTKFCLILFLVRSRNVSMDAIVLMVSRLCEECPPLVLFLCKG